MVEGLGREGGFIVLNRMVGVGLNENLMMFE